MGIGSKSCALRWRGFGGSAVRSRWSGLEGTGLIDRGAKAVRRGGHYRSPCFCAWGGCRWERLAMTVANSPCGCRRQTYHGVGYLFFERLKRIRRTGLGASRPWRDGRFREPAVGLCWGDCATSGAFGKCFWGLPANLVAVAHFMTSREHGLVPLVPAALGDFRPRAGNTKGTDYRYKNRGRASSSGHAPSLVFNNSSLRWRGRYRVGPTRIGRSPHHTTAIAPRTARR